MSHILYTPPMNMQRVDEINTLLLLIDKNREKTGKKSGVAGYYNGHIGGIYEIVTKDEADAARHKSVEPCVAYFPRSYFVRKKTKLKINEFVKRIYNYIKTYSSPL